MVALLVCILASAVGLNMRCVWEGEGAVSSFFPLNLSVWQGCPTTFQHFFLSIEVRDFDFADSTVKHFDPLALRAYLESWDVNRMF